VTQAHNGDDLYEDKFERTYAEIRRLDELRKTDKEAKKNLDEERDRRLDQRMDAQETAVAAALAAAEKAVTAALVASEKAVDKAEVAQAKVDEGQNEFRGTLRDQASTLMPRSETENLIRELRGLITGQAGEIAGLRSRVDIGPPSLQALQTQSDQNQGRRANSSTAREIVGYSVAAIGVLTAIIFGIVALVT